MKNALFVDSNLIKRWQGKTRASQHGRESSNGVLQWSVLGLILFVISITDTEKAENSEISKDANDIKLFCAFIWQTNSAEL